MIACRASFGGRSITAAAVRISITDADQGTTEQLNGESQESLCPSRKRLTEYSLPIVRRTIWICSKIQSVRQKSKHRWQIEARNYVTAQNKIDEVVSNQFYLFIFWKLGKAAERKHVMEDLRQTFLVNYYWWPVSASGCGGCVILYVVSVIDLYAKRRRMKYWQIDEAPGVGSDSACMAQREMMETQRKKADY